MTGTRVLITGVLLGFVLALLTTVAVGLIVVYTGAYNVAATDRHADVVRWAFDTTMHRSVERRAWDVGEPPPVDAAAAEQAAPFYDSTCAHCHGAPGLDRASWARNMRPPPPKLTEVATKWEAREIFWITKHGIRMTGMPAFGTEIDDATLWRLTAFVEQLPGMTSERYEALTGGGHDHDH
jgi:mono/diheme cytochrome c family protein